MKTLIYNYYFWNTNFLLQVGEKPVV